MSYWLYWDRLYFNLTYVPWSWIMATNSVTESLSSRGHQPPSVGEWKAAPGNALTWNKWVKIEYYMYKWKGKILHQIVLPAQCFHTPQRTGWYSKKAQCQKQLVQPSLAWQTTAGNERSLQQNNGKIHNMEETNWWVLCTFSTKTSKNGRIQRFYKDLTR